MNICVVSNLLAIVNNAAIKIVKICSGTYGYRGEGWREGIVREFGIDMYILLYLKWITNKDLLYCTGSSA